MLCGLLLRENCGSSTHKTLLLVIFYLYEWRGVLRPVSGGFQGSAPHKNDARRPFRYLRPYPASRSPPTPDGRRPASVFQSLDGPDSSRVRHTSKCRFMGRFDHFGRFSLLSCPFRHRFRCAPPFS